MDSSHSIQSIPFPIAIFSLSSVNFNISSGIPAQSPCFPRPCGDGGDCTVIGATFRCDCYANYTGNQCETGEFSVFNEF